MHGLVNRTIALSVIGLALAACGASGGTGTVSSGSDTPGIPANPFQGSGTAADHRAAAAFESIPAAYVQAAKSSLRIFYGHTSHGSQVVTGMEMLRSDLYDFGEGDGTLSLEEVSGDLGTDGDTGWADTTRERLEEPGSDVNVVMWSWCGGVSGNSTQGIDAYLAAMDQLERDYPHVKFVYMTGHTDGGGDDGTLRANNARIRAFCAENGKWLYDFEDVESWDPAGAYYPDTDDGCPWCSSWCQDHTCQATVDCAHSHCFNCYLKGKAFWWLLARMAGWSA